MEIHLDRKLSEKRIFPAIDLNKSGTRREDLLLSKEELECAFSIRKLLSSANTSDATDQLLSLMSKTNTNRDFTTRMRDWMNLYERQATPSAARSAAGLKRTNPQQKSRRQRRRLSCVQREYSRRRVSRSFCVSTQSST